MTHDLDNTNPIRILKTPSQYDDASLAEIMSVAIAGNKTLHADDLDPSLEAATLAGVRRSKMNGSILTPTQAAAINMYTMATSLYREPNKCMREQNREALVPFSPYFLLLLTALYGLNLKQKPRVVHHRVKRNLRDKYTVGEEFYLVAIHQHHHQRSYTRAPTSFWGSRDHVQRQCSQSGGHQAMPSSPERG